MTIKKIIIYPTLEVEEYPRITHSFNSDVISKCIKEAFNYSDTVQSKIKHNASSNKNYSEDFKRNVNRWNLDAALNESFDQDTFNSIAQDIFKASYDHILVALNEKIVALQNENKMLIAMPFYLPVPTDADYTIGWAVSNPSSNHLNEHENVGEANAKKFISSYNNYLRANKNNFNKFFDGSSIREVLRHIRSL